MWKRQDEVCVLHHLLPLRPSGEGRDPRVQPRDRRLPVSLLVVHLGRVSPGVSAWAWPPPAFCAHSPAAPRPAPQDSARACVRVCSAPLVWGVQACTSPERPTPALPGPLLPGDRCLLQARTRHPAWHPLSPPPVPRHPPHGRRMLGLIFVSLAHFSWCSSVGCVVKVTLP